MYDPNKDQEEMLRKIVASQMVAPDMVAPPMEAPTAPAMDVGAIVPPPPSFNGGLWSGDDGRHARRRKRRIA